VTEISQKQNEVLQALALIGPMTNYELQLHLDWTVKAISSILQNLKRKELIRVVSYELDRTSHYVPLYAEGGGADARRPPAKPALNQSFSAYLSAKAHRKMGVWAGLMQ
jgi:DNA-binding MarR family transcriptional regulator